MALNALKLLGPLIYDGRFCGGQYRSGVEKRNTIKSRPAAPGREVFAEIIIHIARLSENASSFYSWYGACSITPVD